jgi:hypothetical protein
MDNAITEAEKSQQRDYTQAEDIMTSKQSFIDKYGTLL